MERERLEDLVSGYLEGELAPQEWKELVDELGRDPEARRYLLTVAHLDLAAQDLIRSASPAAPRTSRRFMPRRPAHPNPFSWPLALAAAAILLGVFLLLRLGSSDPTPSIPAPPEVVRKMIPTKPAVGREPENQTPSPLEQERRIAEERLKKLEEEEKRAVEAKRAADRVQDAILREKAEAAVAENQRQRKEEEERLARLKEEEKRAAEPRRESPASPAPDRDKKEERLPQTTRSTGIARLEGIEGEVWIVSSEGKVPAAAGAELPAGQGVETGGAASKVAIVFPDKTRVDLGALTTLGGVSVEKGRRLLLQKGSLRASVSKQPKDQPLIFVTPHGEAKVLGTTLRLSVDPDPKKGTRLEVEEGKVEFKNPARKVVIVESGHYAVAADGVKLAADVLELEGWLTDVKDSAGAERYGKSPEVVDDPLEPGRKCFELNFPTSQQGLVLRLAAKIPVTEFEGVSFEAYAPPAGPKGRSIRVDLMDATMAYASTILLPARPGAWQKVEVTRRDFKDYDKLKAPIFHIYVFEVLSTTAPNAAPEHAFYLRRLQIRGGTAPKASDK